MFFKAFAGKELEPALGDLPVGPRFDDIGSRPQNQMHVIGQDGVRKDINAKDGGEYFESTSNPLATRFISRRQ